MNSALSDLHVFHLHLWVRPTISAGGGRTADLRGWMADLPKLEVPTIHKAYVRAKFQGIYLQNMANNIVQ